MELIRLKGIPNLILKCKNFNKKAYMDRTSMMGLIFKLKKSATLSKNLTILKLMIKSAKANFKP